jgi:translation initiation factor IF-1
MQRIDVIEVEARVMECLPNELYWVEMSNGHRVLGHLCKNLREQGNQILPGSTVGLSLRVFDLSVGRITGVSTAPDAKSKSA